MTRALSMLSDAKKKGGAKKAKPASDGEAGDADIKRITNLAKRLADALQNLPRGKRNTAFDALTAVRDWLNSASIPV